MKFKKRFLKPFCHILMLLSIVLPQFLVVFTVPKIAVADTGGLTLANNSNGAFSITGSQLQVDMSGNGTYTNISNSATIPDKTNVRMTLRWALIDDLETSILSTPTVLTNVPTCFYIPPGGMTGTIKGKGSLANVVFGSYVINTSRQIIITWNANVFQYNGIAGDLMMSTYFDFSNSQGNEIIDLSNIGGQEVTINPQEDAEGKITKTGVAYDAKTGNVTWEILVNEEHQSLSNVVIKDILGNDQTFVSAALLKKEKGGNWEALSSANFRQQSLSGNTVSWEILPKDELKRTAYKVTVTTKVNSLDLEKVKNKASFTSTQKAEDETAEHDFDIVHSEFSKAIDKVGAQEKIEYYKNGGISASKADYDYALIYWTIKIYYPINGSKNDPIQDKLTIAPSEAGTHQYITDSVTIIPRDNQTDVANFSTGFANSNTEMTITPPSVPSFAKRGYEIKYVSKFTKTQAAGWYNGKTIRLNNMASFSDYDEQGSDGYITPPQDLGVRKEARSARAESQQLDWTLTFNENRKTGIKNAKIVDSYITYYQNDIYPLSNPTFNNNDIYNKFKWVYYKRELVDPEQIVVRIGGTVVTQGVDYQLKIRYLDDEDLYLPDGSKLYEGLGYESGFEIELMGGYKDSLNETVTVSFTTQEHVNQYKGYLSKWDDPSAVGVYKWPGLTNYYDYDYYTRQNGWYEDSDQNWIVYRGSEFFNVMTGFWGDNQEHTEKSVAWNKFGYLGYYADQSGNKTSGLLNVGMNLNDYRSVFTNLEKSSWYNQMFTNYLFYHIRYNGSNIHNPNDQLDAVGIYDHFTSETNSIVDGRVQRNLVGFKTTFNTAKSTLPAGTTFSDDLSQMEIGNLGSHETSFTYIKNSVRVYEVRPTIEQGIYHYIHRLAQQSPYHGQPCQIFEEGVDYRVDYNATTKKLEVVFLKETDKAFNIVFLTELSHKNPYSEDPLAGAMFRNRAKLTIPDLDDMEVSTGDITYDKKLTLINKTSTRGEGEDSHINFYTVTVNPYNLDF